MSRTRIVIAKSPIFLISVTQDCSARVALESNLTHLYVCCSNPRTMENASLQDRPCSAVPGDGTLTADDIEKGTD
jgi:hypothetical protein